MSVSPRNTIANFVFAVIASTAALETASAARNTSVKVLFQGTHWFCHTDPTGWPLADFTAVCSQIEPGGKGDFVEFTLDRKGKMRRKPATKSKPAHLGLRGTLT